MSSQILHNILFLDIETVSQYNSFDQLPDEWKELWERKSGFLVKDKLLDTPGSLYNRAAIYAEFGKIICISCGVISGSGNNKKLSLKSFYGKDEQTILRQFSEMLTKWSLGASKYLCAHNGKEFDFPYLCRRLIIHEMPIPAMLRISGKKPWDIPHLDTLELWKFGDYKNYTSLNLLAHTLGIPTPKDDIDGSMVGKIYWEENDIPRIAAYCQKDVITVAQVYLRMYGESTIHAENIEIRQ